MSASQNLSDNNDERMPSEGFVRYFSIMRKYRWLISIIASISALLVIVFSIISLKLPPEESPLPNLYTSQAVLLMQAEDETDLAAALGLISSNSMFSSRFDYAELAMRVLQSNTIIDNLVDEFDIIYRYDIRKSVKTYSRAAILDNSQFEYDRSTRTLTISYVSMEPVFSRDMVKRMVELLSDWFSSRGGTRQIRQKNLLEEKLQGVSTEITELEDQIEDFQREHGALTIEELASSQASIIADLRSQFILKEIEIKNYSKFSKIEDPALLRLKSERDNLQDKILEIELSSRQNLPQIARNFRHLTTDLEIQRRIHEALSQQYELAKLSFESRSIFQILEMAEVPDIKSGPSRSKISIATLLIATMASVVLAFTMNYMNKIRRNPNMLKKLTGQV